MLQIHICFGITSGAADKIEPCMYGIGSLISSATKLFDVSKPNLKYPHVLSTRTNILRIKYKMLGKCEETVFDTKFNH